MLAAFGCGFAATLTAAMLLPGAGTAQALRGHDSRAPVNFDAGAIEIQDRADRVFLTGGVTVTQAGLTLRSARMTVAYTNTGAVDVNRIDALGGVTVTKGDERATGNSAVYDIDARLITMIGNVTLVQRGNRLNGGRVVIDLDSGRATIDGRGAAGTLPAEAPPGTTGAAGGRVTGTFTVPQRDRR
jgi:lipopolysaccharide export system protein LptA